MSHSMRVISPESIGTVFLSTFTPTVVRYLSENMLLTNRETRLVLPTPNPPSIQTFFWSIVLIIVHRQPAPRGTIRVYFAACWPGSPLDRPRDSRYRSHSSPRARSAVPAASRAHG